MDKKTKERKIFSRSNQLDIIQEYLTTKQTASELARKYGSSNPSFIVNWINKFNLEIKDCPI
ncbi:MAG: transposase, partial [Bacteroidetes bacterium]|nr:transposase [Bacteroidota bacterium]